jgi:predicted ATP-grasp superfamily ATP-dependent carboligase
MYADGVQADTVIVGCGQKMMRFATEKEEVLSFAKNIGLTIPSTIILDVGDLNRQTALDLVKSHFGKKSPLYFKATTELGIEAGPGSRYFLANNIDQDGDKAIEFAWARSKVIVQEAVPGVGCGIAGLFVDGAPVCVGGHVRLRESHLTGGVSTYCQAKVVGEAWDASVQLMKELNWTGPAMVEFKITPEGKAVFLELNPRFWGSLPLYMLSGLDIPLACYEVFVTHALHATQEMKQGTRMRHVLSDIRAIRLNRKGMMRVMELGAVVTTTPWIVHEGTFLWTDAEPFIASLIPKRLRAIYLRKHDWHES